MNNETTLKPLDFVMTEQGSFGMVSEVTKRDGSASVSWIYFVTPEKTAWWSEKELTVVNNLPNVLAQNLVHPMGNGSSQPFHKKGYTV